MKGNKYSLAKAIPAVRTWGLGVAVLLTLVSLTFAQGASWTQKSPSTHPESGYYPAMVYDSAHNQVVLFGGVDSSIFTPSPTRSDETWTWDGSTWTKQSPVTKPPARCCFGMAYDAARDQVVIFGGFGPGSGILSDTWVWDGLNWTQKASGPGPRGHVAMTYDAARQQVVLYGGGGGTPTPFGDTWVWDGTTWTQQFPAHSPGLRNEARLVYDSARAEVVLFGGWNGGSQVNETWVWDGVDWTQKFPVTSPSPREDYAAAYDANLQRVVLFSGVRGSCPPVDDLTWTWDGTNWTQESPAASPSGRWGAAAAYDSARGQVVMFGGRDCSQERVLTDTWVWSGGVIPVAIDIKPGSFPNSINLGSGGTVPVAIVSTATFDATTVDPTTVTLASAPVKLTGKGTPMASFQDINEDGFNDLVVHVSTQTLQLSETDTQAVLEGQTFSGEHIRGTDTIRVVP